MPWTATKLTNLETVVLRGTDMDREPIPRWFGRLPKLRHLDLSYNRFIASIPSDLAALSDLTYLSFESNPLTGTIPSWLETLPLHAVLLRSTTMSQERIPSFFGQLSNLTTLKLGNNRFTGGIPSELADLEKFEFLDVSENPLTGTIPGWFATLPELQLVLFHATNLVGNVPFCNSTSNATTRVTADCLEVYCPAVHTVVRSGAAYQRWIQIGEKSAKISTGSTFNSSVASTNVFLCAGRSLPVRFSQQLTNL